jgi:hypothetical protein
MELSKANEKNLENVEFVENGHNRSVECEEALPLFK